MVLSWGRRSWEMMAVEEEEVKEVLQKLQVGVID